MEKLNKCPQVLTTTEYQLQFQRLLCIGLNLVLPYFNQIQFVLTDWLLLTKQ